MNESRAPGHAVVVGLGRTGLSAARYLRASGWQVAVTDSREQPPELATLTALDAATGATTRVRTGGFDEALLEEAALLVVSPGVATSGPFFDAARRRGLDVVGDIELFAREARAPIVGITGTNGKSTVTTLLGQMAARAGVDARVGGNLGKPALDLLEPPAPALHVLELSSFQLDTTHELPLAAATVLNVTADHLDRYGTLEAYAESKARIFAQADVAVINLDDPLVAPMARPGQKALTFSLNPAAGADFAMSVPGTAGKLMLMQRNKPLLAVDELKIQGLHNVANALAALALGDALGLPLTSMLLALREFPGLDHRTQWIADVAGVRFVNDSKGTNVGATLAAVAGLPGTLVMIAGGEGKGQDFSPLAAAFRGKVRHAVLIGRDADAIARVLADVCPCELVSSLEEAVAAAARIAQPGDTVLLSPACASLDMFRDYAHRGSVFSTAVRELAA